MDTNLQAQRSLALQKAWRDVKPLLIKMGEVTLSLYASFTLDNTGQLLRVNSGINSDERMGRILYNLIDYVVQEHQTTIQAIMADLKRVYPDMVGVTLSKRSLWLRQPEEEAKKTTH